MLKLRPFQLEALQALQNRNHPQNHVLCVAPTGSGKSLIFERAAASPQRRTLLVTPLVALARQQWNRLKDLGISPALGAGGAAEVPNSKSGAWIVSPETLTTPTKRAHLLTWKPNLLVVDECHCLWEWGESFRPAFSLLPPLLKEFSIFHSLWLTATLPLRARQELRKVLPDSLREVGGFDLPSRLILEIQKVSWKDRAEYLLQWLSKKDGMGIIFVPTREATFRLSRLVVASGRTAVSYHGGMSSEEKRNIEALIQKGIPDLIIATSAFGMGMDYSFLHHVVLWQVPTSLLSLVQMIGRVGRSESRDGNALVLWDHEDFRLIEWSVGSSSKRREELLDLLEFLNTDQCRRSLLKQYFDGVPDSRPCDRCDSCIRMRQLRGAIVDGPKRATLNIIS